jgi:hypothetical protein
VAAALLAGCGDGETPPPEGRAGAARDECHQARTAGGRPDLVPAALRPGAAVVVAAEEHGSGFEARVLYPRPLRDVMNAVLASARAAGYQVAGTEYEGTDGEIFLSRDGASTEVRLFAVRSCPRITEGVIQEVQS